MQSAQRVFQNGEAKVLVVDDEPEIAQEMSELLLGSGFRCDVANDPYEALDIMRADDDISIIVTDLKMPGLDGLEMVRILHAELPPNRDVEVVVVTGHAGTDEAIKALRLGVTDFLTKPVLPDHLIHVVKGACLASRLRGLERQIRDGIESVVAEPTAEVQTLSDDLRPGDQHENRPIQMFDNAACTGAETLLPPSATVHAAQPNDLSHMFPQEEEKWPLLHTAALVLTFSAIAWTGLIWGLIKIFQWMP